MVYYVPSVIASECSVTYLMYGPIFQLRKLRLRVKQGHRAGTLAQAFWQWAVCARRYLLPSLHTLAPGTAEGFVHLSHWNFQNGTVFVKWPLLKGYIKIIKGAPSGLERPEHLGA